MEPSNTDLLQVFEALANPHRMRIIASLRQTRKYVSELAREIGMSRPLLYMHLKRLESAGLVSGSLELSEDGKAMKFFELNDFEFNVTPESVAAAAKFIKSDGALEDASNDREEEEI